MDKKQKEALIMALLGKGETYREITKKAGVSPNTIKTVLNRAGLNESTSISSRAFELFLEGKTPLQVCITLNLEAEKAILYQ
jgi:DNA-binding NarL/FixJ family response regulator